MYRYICICKCIDESEFSYKRQGGVYGVSLGGASGTTKHSPTL